MKLDGQKLLDGFLLGFGAGAGYAAFQFVMALVAK